MAGFYGSVETLDTEAVERERRRIDLAKIHLAKRQLGLDDTAYRSLLRNVAGAESAAVLDRAGRLMVLEHLRWLGFSPRPARRRASPGQFRKIRALWLDLHRNGLVRDPTEPAMRRYIRRMTGLARPDRLSLEQASTVIETLKQWRKRSPARADRD